MKIILFTRHSLTDKQIDEIKGHCSKFDVEYAPIDLGAYAAKALNTASDVEEVGRGIIRVLNNESGWLYGVLPAPLREWLLRWFAGFAGLSHYELIVHEAWNIQRTVEGGKPTFEHKAWVVTHHFGRGDFRC